MIVARVASGHAAGDSRCFRNGNPGMSAGEGKALHTIAATWMRAKTLFCRLEVMVGVEALLVGRSNGLAP